MKKQLRKFPTVENSESGKIGYLIAWLMGVPASILLIILLIRGG
jgi:hypothetical protein